MSYPRLQRDRAHQPRTAGPPKLERQGGSFAEALGGTSPTDTLGSDFCLQNFERSVWAFVGQAQDTNPLSVSIGLW